MTIDIAATAMTEELNISDLLIAQHQMSLATITCIQDVMRTAKLDFGAAALHLGLISESDIVMAQLQAKRRQASGRHASFVETAVRKLTIAHRTTVLQGEPGEPSRELLQANDPEHPHGERVRALRTELMLLSGRSRHDNVLAILSPCRSEGRSQLCAELAIAFSQLDRNTLLIDADMRRPRQHELFGTDNERGLSQTIQNGTPPCIHPIVSLPHLALLTAGQVPPNPLELLSDASFRQMMERWRREYDFVIVDTPPIAEFVDGLAIAPLAQQVLILTRAQHTSYQDAREMMRRLARTQSRVIGAVVNHY